MLEMPLSMANKLDTRMPEFVQANCRLIKLADSLNLTLDHSRTNRLLKIKFCKQLHDLSKMGQPIEFSFKILGKFYILVGDIDYSKPSRGKML